VIHLKPSTGRITLRKAGLAVIFFTEADAIFCLNFANPSNRATRSLCQYDRSWSIAAAGRKIASGNRSSLPQRKTEQSEGRYRILHNNLIGRAIRHRREPDHHALAVGPTNQSGSVFLPPRRSSCSTKLPMPGHVSTLGHRNNSRVAVNLHRKPVRIADVEPVNVLAQDRGLWDGTPLRYTSQHLRDLPTVDVFAEFVESIC